LVLEIYNEAFGGFSSWSAAVQQNLHFIRRNKTESLHSEDDDMHRWNDD